MTTKFKIGDSVSVAWINGKEGKAIVLDIDQEDSMVRIKDKTGWSGWVPKRDLTFISSAEDTHTNSMLELQAAITTMEITLAAMKESLAKLSNRR